jgi:Fe2+ or Zn2+ uptake regulation protein
MSTDRQAGVGPAEIEDAVMEYLRNHPNAADTLDGIVDWWLPQQRYETARARIASALIRLVDAGLLHRHSLPGGRELYELAGTTGDSAPPH